jgi:hypothetical protein
MSPFTILSCSIAIAMMCGGGATAAETASPFKNNAFVGRDSVENVTALFVELTPEGRAPAQIDLITFYRDGVALATLKNVPARALPAPSRWVYAALPYLLSVDQQNNIRQATSATFTASSVVANATLATTLDWMRYLPDRKGTGSCPNCTKTYLCHCVPTQYNISVANVPYCAAQPREACNKLPEPQAANLRR